VPVARPISIRVEVEELPPLLTLEEAAQSPPDKLAAFKDRLAASIGPYADNPAFQALLELEREGRLGSLEAKP
jgi:hypothetical protein